MGRLRTPQEVAKFIAVIPRTVKEWLRRGNLKGVIKVRNMWRVRESDLDAFIRARVNENSSSREEKIYKKSIRKGYLKGRLF